MLTTQQSQKLETVSTAWPASKPDFKPNKSKWFSNNHAAVFSRLLNSKPNGIYLELGTWTGAGSASFVLGTFPAMTVVCVDTFNGSEEHLAHPVQSKIAANLWPIFCVNCWEERERTYPIRKPSVEGMHAFATTGLSPDFIYIDAAHDADSVFADVEAALKLFPKAVVFGDDYVLPNRGHRGVYDALERAKKEKLIRSEELRNFDRIWYLTRNLK